MSTQQWAAGYEAGSTALWAVDQRILDWLAQLRMATSAQLNVLAGAGRSERPLRASLGRLAAAGLASSVPLVAGRRTLSPAHHNPARVWFLTPDGLEVAAPAADRNYRITAKRASNDKQAHTLAVTDTAIAFTRWLAAAGHDITPGDCDVEFAHMMADRSAKRFGNLQVSDLRIRAILSDADSDTAITRLVEVDRGTESVQHLVDKVRGYARVLSYKVPQQRDRPDGVPQWRMIYSRFPKLVFVFADPAASPHRLQRRQDQLLNLLAEDKLLLRPLRELAPCCTSLTTLRQHGPLQAIFQTVHDGHLVDILGRPALTRSFVPSAAGLPV